MQLLFFIYIAFIGLGLPDSLFGTAWPAIYSDWNIPFSYGSFVSSLTCLGTMISSMLSAKVIKKFGTGKVTAVSTLLTALALFGYSCSNSYIFILLCALPLGIGAGAIDTALNNYVALNYSASHMNFLHCFYGIGITISPFIIAKTIAADGGWKKGYFIAFIIQSCIAVLMFASLPLWKCQKANAQNIDTQESEDEQIDVLSLKQLLHTPYVKAMWLLFFFSCSIETTCASWGSTFLVEMHGVAPQNAASFMIAYFAGMAIGRLISGLISHLLRAEKIVVLGICILSVGITLVFIPVGGPFLIAGFFMIGAGNGPLFPNFNYLTPILFGEKKATSVIGSQMTVATMAFLIVPIIFGQLAGLVGLTLFPIAIAVFAVIIIATYAYLWCWIKIRRA
ncbi:MAG: MFS transporter [Lachnospiraceae bacterium]|nr:MFS transporter [Candidatus Colinaster equi]